MNNCASTTGWIAILAVAILVVVVFNIWGKGMLKIIPILLGVVAGSVFSVAARMRPPVKPSLSVFHEAAWIGLPGRLGRTPRCPALDGQL